MLNIDILNQAEFLWSEHFETPAADVRFVLEKIAPQFDLHPLAEISIVLTDDLHIKKLNSEFRGKDSATNVLSFETGDDKLLGDIVLSIDTLVREAEDLGISVHDHFTHLLIHGFLHLMGHDHIDDADADEMQLEEIDLLKQFDIDNPYSS